MHLLSEVHFWSTQDDVTVKHTDFGAFKYFPKKEINDNLLYNGKKSYCEQRGVIWNPTHKRPFKIKDKLKELEEHLFQNKVVCSSWENNELQLLLSRGLLVNITLNINNSIITSVAFNKALTTKVQSELICDGAIFGQQIACVFTDGRILCHGGAWRDGWIIEAGAKRRVSLHGELLCVWGRVSTEHPQPWSPLIKDHQRANVLVYWVGTRGPELQAHKKTEGEPVAIIISRIHNKVVIAVEQKVSLRGAVCVEVNTLELTTNTLNRTAVTSVPLQTQVSCCALSDNENRLILGCIDGSVALLDRNRGSTHIIKTSIIPTFAVWHSCGAVACISNEKGQLQYFDTALNRINTQLIGEDCTPVGLLDLSGYFNMQPDVSSIKWGPKDLIVMLEHGPLIVVTHLEASLTFTSLVQQYLKMGKIKKAIAVLLSWEWNDQCFSALQRIIAHLMKLPLTEENAQNLQNTLSSFHNSPVPLSTNVKHKYGAQVRALTRRFFHQLVRYKMFETAFLLAVDIGHHDLFMDLYYCAINIGEKEMAAAARAQASALLSRCSSEASCCSRSSCSQCSDSYSGSSNESSSRESQDKLSFVSSEIVLPTSRSSSDNFLTTNFNDINPKTYQNETCSYTIDLPKAIVSPKPVFHKTSHYSKSSGASGSVAPVANTVLKTPPLPVAPALPLPLPLSLSNRNYSSQLVGTSTTTVSMSQSFNNSISTPLLPYTVHPTATALINNKFWNNYTFSSSSNFTPTPPANREPEQEIKNSHSPYTVSLPSSSASPITPALPQHPPQCVPYMPPQTPNASGAKKQQAKVKFSDTVTAFIVPEVKRPVRPPPPPHITDPQKELADSLPLCHPNEDYLKDFTPARRSDSDEAPSQAKIKVVHFGVV